jgi:hypothetical protein
LLERHRGAIDQLRASSRRPPRDALRRSGPFDIKPPYLRRAVLVPPSTAGESQRAERADKAEHSSHLPIAVILGTLESDDANATPRARVLAGRKKLGEGHELAFGAGRYG